MQKYKVWECKIVVPADTELPSGFDAPPRSAAQMAVESHGIELIAIFSGWGGSLTEIEEQTISNHVKVDPCDGCNKAPVDCPGWVPGLSDAEQPCKQA